MAKWPDLPGFEEDKELLGASMAVIDEKLVVKYRNKDCLVKNMFLISTQHSY